MHKPSTLGVIGAVILVAAFGFIPKLRTARTMSFGTPVPQPLFQLTLFPLPPGESACLDSVAVEPGRQAALFRVDPARRPGPPLRFTIRGVSFAQHFDFSGGYGTGVLTAAFNGPPRSLLTVVCIRNLGRHRVALTGTTDPRTLSRPRMTIGGRAVDGTVSLAFTSTQAEGPKQVASRIIKRITAFKPVWVTSWLVAGLLAVVIVGAFAGPLFALWRSFLDDEREPV